MTSLAGLSSIAIVAPLRRRGLDGDVNGAQIRALLALTSKLTELRAFEVR